MSGAGDDFTHFKFMWLDQIAADHAVSAGAFRLAYLIASKFLNRRTREAYPGQTKLATLLGLKSTKGVKFLINQLVRGGHLQVVVAHGRGLTNRYLPVAKSSEVNSSDAAAPAEAGEGLSLFPEISAHGSPPPPRAPKPNKPNFTAEFEEFWLQYPRKVAKEAAGKAYARARSGGATAADILNGALRYGAERQGQDPKYTKHPATWLTGRCWDDEALPSAQREHSPNDHGRAASATHLATALGGYSNEQ